MARLVDNGAQLSPKRVGAALTCYVSLGPEKMHITNTDTADCFGNQIVGFVLRQNCNCDARQNKRNALTNDTEEAKELPQKEKEAAMCMQCGAYT